MSFQPTSALVCWRIRLASPPARVYELLATDQGRAMFWAESAVERAGAIDFVFPNGANWRGEILAADAPRRYTVRYYGGSTTTFELRDDGQGGTDVILTDQGVPETDRTEVTAGWVSVLLALKAAADFGVDLRNHDPRRTWDEGYADN